ncbi:hypothetical protein B6259_09050 [Ruminococcaceae bacterium CPB6]|nr:hypothetical protein B6259_09050 [Ruminococcaceae bacterium CPB6]
MPLSVCAKPTAFLAQCVYTKKGMGFLRRIHKMFYNIMNKKHGYSSDIFCNIFKKVLKFCRFVI